MKISRAGWRPWKQRAPPDRRPFRRRSRSNAQPTHSCALHRSRSLLKGVGTRTDFAADLPLIGASVRLAVEEERMRRILAIAALGLVAGGTALASDRSSERDARMDTEAKLDKALSGYEQAGPAVSCV